MQTYEELFAQVELLKAQLNQHEQQLQIHKNQIKEQNHELKAKTEQIQELQALNNWYTEQLKLSRQKRFGKSSEQMSHSELEQINLFNEAEAERNPLLAEPTIEEALNQDETETIEYDRRKNKGNRRQTLDNLPVETIEYLLPEEQVCPQCSNHLHIMTKEIRKELKIIPAKVSVVEHVSYSYACRHCEKNDVQTPIIKAPSPKALIPNSFTSPSSLAYIINQKFTLGLPLYRQEQELKRQGVKLSRQTMSNWMIQGAKLLEPLTNELKIDLLTKEIIHADETTLEVLCEPGRTAELKSYMWLYRSASCDEAIVLYDYQQGRSGKLAKQYLDGYKGYLVTDGWNGYKLLESDVTLCGCWAHAKRKFYEALSIRKKDDESSPEFIGHAYCQKLFALEEFYRDEKKLNAEELHKVHDEIYRPLLEEFYQWVNMQERKTLPKSLLGKALDYVQNQKPYLLAFLADGRIEISNNIAERAIKPFVIGRKNWLFCNTPAGAKSSAILYSVIETAKENSLNPYAYLTWVFEEIQLNPDISARDLLPYGSNVPKHCKAEKPKKQPKKKKQKQPRL